MPVVLATRSLTIRSKSAPYRTADVVWKHLANLFTSRGRFIPGASIELCDGKATLKIVAANSAYTGKDRLQFAMKLRILRLGKDGAHVDGILDDLCIYYAAEISKHLNPGQNLDLGAYSLDLDRNTTNAREGFDFLVAGLITDPGPAE